MIMVNLSGPKTYISTCRVGYGCVGIRDSLLCLEFGQSACTVFASAFFSCGPAFNTTGRNWLTTGCVGGLSKIAVSEQTLRVYLSATMDLVVCFDGPPDICWDGISGPGQFGICAPLVGRRGGCTQAHRTAFWLDLKGNKLKFKTNPQNHRLYT